MPMKPGNYFIISALIRNEVMYLKDGEDNLWSRTLKDAKFFYHEDRANEAKKAARRMFSKFVVKNMQVTTVDVFGQAKNLLVSFT